MAEYEIAGVRCCSRCQAIYRADFERCPIDGAPIRLVDRDPLIGTVVAKHYLVEELIGEGGMGRVYRAHHTRLHHKHFALKIMVGDLAATLAMRMRFAQEADSASRLAHPNLVSVVDYGKTEEGLLFLVMDLIEGRTLAQAIAEQAPFAPRRAVAIARQVCHGLAHAHDCSLVHRDFKPENVMIRGDAEEERAVIMDFGLAISRDTDAEEAEDSPARLTSVGIALGTPIYAAPEQTHGLPVDHRADLFALGVTLYEMLAGRTPFDGTGIEVIRQNAGGTIPAIATRGGVAVAPALEAVVRRLMARSPGDRYESARDVIAALDAIDDGMTATATTPELIATPSAETPATRPMRRHRRWWIAASGLAMAAVVLPVIGTLRGDATTVATVAPPASSPVEPPSVRDTAEDAPAQIADAPVLATPPVAASTSPPRPVGRRPPPRRPPAPDRPTVTSPPPEAPAVEVVATPPSEPEPAENDQPLPLPAAPVPPPAPVPRPLTTRARAEFRSLEVRGSLSDAVIRRALERVEPRLRGCFAKEATASHQSNATTVRLTFVVDDTRQASSVRAVSSSWPALAACVGEVARELRTNTAPDVGSVPVSVDVAFTPEGPA